MRCAAPPRRGFTLLELMVVVALLAVAAGMSSLALRDSAASKLEEEAVRLSALLEGARAQSRTLGVAVVWMPADAQAEGPAGFRFQGLPPGLQGPQAWLDPRTQAQVVGAPYVILGPEPVIGAQRVALSLEGRRLTLATDGLSPFSVLDAEAEPARP